MNLKYKSTYDITAFSDRNSESGKVNLLNATLTAGSVFNSSEAYLFADGTIVKSVRSHNPSRELLDVFHAKKKIPVYLNDLLQTLDAENVGMDKVQVDMVSFFNNYMK